LKLKLECSISIFVLLMLLALSVQDQSTWDKIKDQIESARKGDNAAGLSNDKITAGLKEALNVSTGKAVTQTGRPDGFLKNEAIKILLPEKLRTAGKTLRMVGMGSQVDALEV